MRALPCRRAVRRTAVLGAAVMLLPALAVAASAQAAGSPSGPVTSAVPALSAWPAVPVEGRLQPWLASELAAGGTEPLRVMVSGETTASAVTAARAAGLTVQQTWDKVGIVVALGTPDQISAVVGRPGVTSVDGDQPLEYTLDSAHGATRSQQALETYRAPDGGRVDGSGVSIAVIDSGIDSRHPMFLDAGGVSKVVQNRKNVCGITAAPGLNESCFQPVSDTDSVSAGGHGSHVSGIAAGFEVVTRAPAGTALRGAAPGAKLVGLSVGAAVSLLDADAAMNWVLEHQQNPCRPAARQSETEVDVGCPPIRVTNHSYGPAADEEEGSSFDEDSPTVRIQRMLVGQGVTVVWAAGNSGGDGDVARTNPPGMDPTPGVLMVASYDDGQNGNRDNQLSEFSSRGADGRPQTYPDISAPGDGITSACRPNLAICTGAPSFDTGNYQTISGTSMATPYIAGVVAQLVQVDPAIAPAAVESLLEDTAHKFEAGAPYVTDPTNAGSTASLDKGHGLVDVASVLAAQQALPEPGAPGPAGPPGPDSAPEEPQPSQAPTIPFEPSPSPSPQARTIDDACPQGEGGVPRGSRQDIDSNFHALSIDCMVWWQIAEGTSSSRYAPRAEVTREQMATFIARLIQKSGGQLPANPPNAFDDDDGRFHERSIDQLAAAGIIDGRGDRSFSPLGNVLRGQMAKFLVNAYEYRSPQSLDGSQDYFSDDDGSVFEPFINKSAAGGFTEGRNGRYEVSGTVRRDAMASFLARALDLLVAEGTTPAKRQDA